ncbi:MAG: hypothetical protein K0S34_1605 [Bacillales bacterium]|jgi:hypothetical protein|nr:hypothetical protein [Bacillales bacterium]
MYIKRAYGIFINIISTILIGIITSGLIQNFQRNSGFINIEVLLSAGLLYLIVLLIIVYMYSNKVIIDGEILSYENFFENKSIVIKDIKSIGYKNINHDVKTIFPVLHITSSEETIEIPYYLFEKDLDDIIRQLERNSRQQKNTDSKSV